MMGQRLENKGFCGIPTGGVGGKAGVPGGEGAKTLSLPCITLPSFSTVGDVFLILNAGFEPLTPSSGQVDADGR